MDFKSHCKNYYVLQNQYSEENIYKSKRVLGDLLYAHGLALGILECVIKQYIDEPGETNEAIHEKLWLISAFYQSIDICEELIKQGRYTIAAPILRQEYEIIAKINTLKENKYDNKKVVNPKFLYGFQKAYGLLSELTHLLKNVDDIIFCGEEDNELNPVNLFPTFNEDLCVDLYGLHIYFILIIVNEIETLYSEMYGYESNEEIGKKMDIVLKVLIEKGVIKHEDETK